MQFTPFQIRCTTCESKLAVRNAALLGQVLACPKCGSMVHITRQENQDATPFSETVSPTPPIMPIAVAPPVLDSIIPPVDFDDTAEGEPPILRRPRRHSERSTRFILAIILISIAVLLGMAYVAILNQPASEKVGNNKAVQEPLLTKEHVAAEPDDTDAVPVASDEPELEQERETEPELPEPEIALSKEETPPAEPIAAETEIQSDDTATNEPILVPQPIQDRDAIDVNVRLQLAIYGMKAEQTTLYDAVTKLADMVGVPLTWDVPGLRLFSIPLDKPIRLDFGETTVGEALAAILAQHRLAALVEHEQIFIYPIDAAGSTLREVRYDIMDIVRSSVTPGTANGPNSISATILVDVIPRMISPFSWQSPEKQGNEEAGSITAEGTVLIVKQTEINQKEVFRFLEMIRSARKIPLISTTAKEPQDAERVLQKLFPEQTCPKMLAKPLTLHYSSPTPLAEIFKILTPALKMRFFVNHRVLNESQYPISELSGTVHVEKGTIHEALRQLLHSVDQLELTYRIVDHDAIEIITWDATLLPEYATLESHFYGTKLRSQTEQTVDEMLEMLKNTVEPDSWSETTFGGGAILLDLESETFFIRQSQPIQRIIREWLGE